MTDYENKELTGQPAEPAADKQTSNETELPASPVETASPEQAESAPQPAAYTAPETPHLTLEPDPVPPEVPTYETETNIPGSAAEPFHMPDPPRAPEPPRQEPAYQQAPPTYTQPPQYGAPQYQAPTYGQPVQQPYQQPAQQQYYNTPPVGYNQKSRIAAGLLAILFGVFGVHNYYLGFNSRATIQLVVSLAGGLLTCGVATVAMEIWAFVEGVLILSGSPSRIYDGNGVIMKD